MSSAICNLQYTIPLGLVGVQRGAEVALAVAGHNKDDQLAGILRAAADLQRSGGGGARADANHQALFSGQAADRKSTRLNSSHVRISYAVFCLKKKKKI